VKAAAAAMSEAKMASFILQYKKWTVNVQREGMNRAQMREKEQQ
jgi:hypothetical protein